LAGAPGRGNYVCPFTFIGNNLEKTAFVVWKPNIYSESIGVKEYVEAKACPSPPLYLLSTSLHSIF
jgi:hypothetical protein